MSELDFVVLRLNCLFRLVFIIPKNVLDETCISYWYYIYIYIYIYIRTIYIYIYMTMNVDSTFMKNWVSVNQN
jgi:hypothetical protein